MKLIITQEDIDNGIAEDPCWCPVANAIARQCNIPDEARHDSIYVGRDCLYIKHYPVFTIHNYPAVRLKVMPKELSNKIEAFDNGEDIQPFEIEIPYNEH